MVRIFSPLPFGNHQVLCKLFRKQSGDGFSQPREIPMTRLLVLAFILASWAGVQAADVIYFDDPEDPYFEMGDREALPDTVVAKFIFISFPDLADTTLDQVFVQTIPDQFKEFFLDQSRGKLTVECSTITVPGDNTIQWVASHGCLARNGPFRTFCCQRGLFCSASLCRKANDAEVNVGPVNNPTTPTTNQQPGGPAWVFE